MRANIFLIKTILCGLFSVVAASAADVEFPREQIEFFERQIRPALAAQCWNCHSDAKQESGLRLDSRAAILKGGDRGDTVKSGDGAASLLVHAIRYGDELKMPPNGRFTPEQVAAFSRWIDMGLPWPVEKEGSARTRAWKSHWSFQPVAHPVAPTIPQETWTRSPIDAFVLEKLHANSTSPAAEADRRTLIRRATFDLHGLPPTPEDVAEFLADQASDAFERLIDRLLSSPRYGERWGRYWLDVARYADNKGYVFFEEPSYPWAYTYRDYVIRSLNEDKPYDQFIVEQLAADQLERHGDDSSLAAMGYLTVGSHFMGNVHDIIDDRIDVVTRGLMGLTVTCARCHDHKYDPIPTADYYSLYGVFRSTVEPLVPPQLATKQEPSAYQRFTIELSVRQQKLDDFIKQKHAALVNGARTRVAEYLLAARAAAERPAVDDFMLIADPDDLNPAMIVRWQAYLEKLAAVVEPIATAAVPVTTGQTHDLEPTHPVWGPWFVLAKAKDDQFAAERDRLQLQITSGARGTTNRLVAALFASANAPASIDELATRYGDLMKSIHQEWQIRLNEAIVLKRPTPIAFEDPDKEALRQELYGEFAPANVPPVFGWGFLSLLPDRVSQGEYQKVLKDVEQWIINGPGAPPRAMVLVDGEIHEPRIFQRGNPSRPGETVSRHFLTAISEGRPFEKGSGRLEMARAIVDPSNPLTSRVFVNRLWQDHFGLGLVRTPSDFGVRSDPPTHPELLDWLAREFSGPANVGIHDSLDGTAASDRRYSVKRMQRTVMSSQVYRQVSDGSSDGTDPENRLWHRFNRRRLDFEAMRDALLFVTGQLQDRIGGPSQNLLDGFQPRRTLYSFLNRLDLPGIYSVFDFPSPAATSGQRETTTISPQALFLMNGRLIEAVADAVPTRQDLSSQTDVGERVQRLYQILFQRTPKQQELRLATDFLGVQPTPTAWSQFTHALLLTNEFVFVD